MLTVQILTKNNFRTIRATLESLSNLDARIMVGDLGSTDGTQKICSDLGAEVYQINEKRRDLVRNNLVSMAGFGPHLVIEPWEIFSGGQSIGKFKNKPRHVRVLSGRTVTHEIRFWDGKQEFVNPVFERLNVTSGLGSDIVLYSRGGLEEVDALVALDDWKNREPLSLKPDYYRACVYFSSGRYEEFIPLSEHYLKSEKFEGMAKVMMRYYYAMASLLRGRCRPALQNINLCLCCRPLMAEFWCLMADIYYHLLRKFDSAKGFYENAKILGSRRTPDFEPMDIDKYRIYPEKMIDSCNKIIGAKEEFVQTNRR